MKTAKIVVIGAGSASFGLVNLSAILRTPELKGSELCLVDIDEERLQLISRLAHRMNEEWRAEFTINAATDRSEYLDGAEFVVMSLATDRDECWQIDQKLAQKNGIMHYAENGGPGALMHTSRNLAVAMPIFEDMKKICPDAWLLNFTNPVPRICAAAANYADIKTVGICHQINFGYLIVGNILSQDLDIDVPDNYVFTWDDAFGDNDTSVIAAASRRKVDILAAGLNHFTWMLSIRDHKTGVDLYPLFRQRLAHHYDRFEPLSREIFDVFGLFPVPGDCHLCEYLPYTHNVNRKTWDRYEIQGYSFPKSQAHSEGQWSKIKKMADGIEPIEPLKNAKSEHAEEIIRGISGNGNHREDSLNIPNQGYITNLPDDSIVEVPGWCDADGVRGEIIGSLPEPIAELCRRQITIANLSVDAALTGDRQIARQALALDPMIDDLQVAEDLLNEYLHAHSRYLPQFIM